jgi:hypothetical protein
VHFDDAKFKKLLNEIAATKKRVLEGMQQGVQRAAHDVLNDVKERTNYPFQTVPSYLLAHRYNPEFNPKEYPPGTKATFAKRTGKEQRLGNLNLVTPDSDELPIQLFPGDETHALHSTLNIRDANLRENRSTADVGYPGGAPEYIKAVLFGTRGHRGPRGRRIGAMIARPFLTEALANTGAGGLKSSFVEHVAENVQDGMRRRKS